MSRARHRFERVCAALISIASLAVFAAGVASAQTLRVATSEAPHYQGAPIEIQITAEGFEEEPTPSIEAGGANPGTLVDGGVQPSISSSIVIVGGQIRQTKEVKFVFSYRLRVDRAGPVEIAPFVVSQGATRLESQPLHLDVLAVPTSDQLSVELEIPEEAVYVGERVPVAVHFRLQGSVRKNLHRYSLRVPFFDQSESFRFLEVPDPGDTDVEIETEKGLLSLKGEARANDAQETLVVTLRRIAVPLREGEVKVPAAHLDVEEGTRYRRDLFGGRQATRVRKWRASDRERSFAVKPIPAAETPPGFAGAVGSGFSLHVSADRTVVQVGDPIALTLELRGDGNLETASLPRLDAKGLLPPEQFRVPDGEIAGQVEEGTKRFVATVRVVDPNVREIPALQYAWFDPDNRQFQTTQSRPIALSVRDARIIGAGQVERDASPSADSSARPDEAAAGSTSGRGPLILTGADLAIERDPQRLVRVDSAGAANPLILAGLYVSGVLVVLLAHLDRRRRNVDPAVVARRKAADEQLRRMSAAGSLPANQAADEMARALRKLIAEIPESNRADLRSEVDSVLGECDARSYAPESDRAGAPRDAAFHRRAVELAERIAEGAG